MRVVALVGLLLAVACAGEPEEGAYWVPEVGGQWQWQLSELPVDTSVDVDVYDVDLFETPASTVDALHDQGRHVICYVSVGTWEPGRPDSDDFPEAMLGESLVDFPDERWLDIRRLEELTPILGARFDLCEEKGFDAVEPDNVDGYVNESGFPLTAADQLEFNRLVAELAHQRGLSVGLKNDLEQIPELVEDFDWALNEECVEFDECEAYESFIEAGKAVLHVEYHVGLDDLCPVTDAVGGFSSMTKDVDLGVAREPCP